MTETKSLYSTIFESGTDGLRYLSTELLAEYWPNNSKMIQSTKTISSLEILLIIFSTMCQPLFPGVRSHTFPFGLNSLPSFLGPNPLYLSNLLSNLLKYKCSSSGLGLTNPLWICSCLALLMGLGPSLLFIICGPTGTFKVIKWWRLCKMEPRRTPNLSPNVAMHTSDLKSNWYCCIAHNYYQGG